MNLLLFLSDAIIPILIFRIDLDTMSTVTSSYLSLFSQVFLCFIQIPIQIRK